MVGWDRRGVGLSPPLPPEGPSAPFGKGRFDQLPIDIGLGAHHLDHHAAKAALPDERLVATYRRACGRLGFAVWGPCKDTVEQGRFHGSTQGQNQSQMRRSQFGWRKLPGR